MKRPFRPVARDKSGAVDIYLDGVIDARNGTSNIDIREQLARANGAPIVLHVNCDGGSVTEGMAIYNTLRAYKGRKVCIIEGIAASMGSVIPMSCDEIRIAKGAFIMIHNPLVPTTGGNATDLRKTADDLEKAQGELLDIYGARTGIERSKLESLMGAETYFTAEEALEIGFVDKIEGELEATMSVDMVARLDPKKVPAALLALAKGKKQMAVKKNSAKVAELEAQLAAAKAEEEEEEEPKGEEEEEEEEEEPAAEEEEEKKATAQVVALVKSLTGGKTLKGAAGMLASLVAKGAQGAVTARAEIIKSGIASGLIPPSLKSWAAKCDEETFSSFITGLGGAKAFKLGTKHKPPVGSDDETDVTPSAGASKSESIVGKAFGYDAKKMVSLRGRPVKRGTLSEGGNQ